MSNADPAEVSMVVSRDGVTVEKSFEPDDFPVPAIAFVIRSEREESVSIRLTDEVPDQVDAEDIGFHPKYGAEFWSVEGEIIVFEREFEAGEEYTTVYGLRASQTDDVESYLGEPTIDDVDPPSDDYGEAAKDVIGDEADEGEEIDLESPSDKDIEAAIAAADEATGEAPTSVDAEAETDDDEVVEPLHLNDPNDGGDVESAGETVAETTDTSSSDGKMVDTASDDAILASLANEIRAGNASADDVAALRQAFAPGGDGSTDARIKQLQSEFADLRAYTNALEEFLDESGEGMDLIRDVQDSIQHLESELATAQSRTDDTIERVGTIEEKFGEVENDLDDAVEDVEAVDGRIDTVEATVSDVDDAVDSVESDVEDVHDDLSAVETEINDVHGTVDELSDDVADVGESLDDLEDIEDRIISLEEEFDDAREDLQALSEMREQLSSVFGAQVTSEDNEDDE